MSDEQTTVFFYGLFMDEALLASKGIKPSRVEVGYVDSYGLRIGARATLMPDEGNRAYGVLMSVGAENLRTLYSDESVADYVPETLPVVLGDGTQEPAACYNLPESKLQGTNPEYASALLALARKLDLPSDYLKQIADFAA